MGRPQEEAPSSYPPESHPQPQNIPLTPESGRPYNAQEISPPAYEASPSYPPANHTAPQPPPPPQPQAPNPSPYPPPNQPSNAAYPPQPASYPPQNPPNNAAYPPQPASYPPNNAPYPPQPAPYPPNSPRPEFQTPTGYGPQPVSYPPPNPSTAVPQQHPPPPASPYKPPRQNGAAQGIPVQPQFQPAPVPHPYRPTGTVPWSTGIFDCMDDPMNALVTACVPCLTFGQIAEIVDGGNTSCGTSACIYGAIAFVLCVPCLLSCTYRTKLRSKYGLVETPAPDWITHFLCEWCALCQEYRELRARGLDPELGWHGNMARNQQPQVGMVPPTHQTMMG